MKKRKTPAKAVAGRRLDTAPRSRLSEEGILAQLKAELGIWDAIEKLNEAFRGVIEDQRRKTVRRIGIREKRLR